MEFIFQRIARNYSLAASLFLLTTIGALCNVGFGLLIKGAIDTLHDASTDLFILFIFSGLFVLVRFITPMIHGAKEFACAKLSDEEGAELRQEAFSALHQVGHGYQTAKNTGEVIRQTQVGVDAFKLITRAIFLNVLPVILDVLLVIGIVTYFFGWRYSAAITSIIAIYLAIVVFYTNRRMPYLKEVSDTDRTLAAFTYDSYLNQESVKLFTPLQNELDRHWNHLDSYLMAQRKSRRNLYFLTALTSVVSSLGCLLLLTSSSLSISQGTMTIGGYLMLATYLFQVFLPLNSLGLSFRQIKKGVHDTTLLENILQLPSDEEDRNVEMQLDSAKPIMLSFENLSLRAPEGAPIFNELEGSLRLSSLAFVIGKSGSGKSSLVRMMCGLIKPSSGKLFINGYDCQRLSRESVRNNMAIASQDIVLFNSTLKENLLIAKPDCSDDELIAVLNKVGLGYLFTEARGGLSCHVGERGQKMSGGEKQRICLARALLKKAPFIVLDEPTAALDTENVKNIRAIIEEVSKESRLLVITHDLSIIKEEIDDVYELSNNQLRPTNLRSLKETAIDKAYC